MVDLELNQTLLESKNENLNKIGATIAGIHKKIYFKSDIKIIENTINSLESVYPTKSDYYETIDRLTRKEIIVWKCECGKENGEEQKICKVCKRDIHGMRNSTIDLKEIKDNLRHRLNILKENFS